MKQPFSIFANVPVLTAVIWLSIIPSFSQVESSKPPSNWAATPAPVHNGNIEILKAPAELPQLPLLSGNPKFLRGYIQSVGSGWTTYQMTFLSKDERSKVKDWYENSLATCQWKILTANGASITANHKDGHMCTVIFNPCTTPGYHTQLAIFYSLAPRTGATQ